MIGWIAWSRAAGLASLLVIANGCGTPVVQAPAANGRGTNPGGTAARADQQSALAREPPAITGGAGGAGGADGGASPRPPPLPLSDTDFTESDRARDPFRSFAQEFVPVGPTIPIDEHVIKLREYGLDQLTLVAVILGTDNPYAMVTDTTQRGTIIRRGDYVGRPETIAGTDGLMPHQVPWRVARIVGSRVTRDADNNLTEVPGEVVFEREDRLNPSGARAEHVITLVPGSQASRPSDSPANSQPALPLLPGFGPGGSPFLPSSLGAPGTSGMGTTVQSFTQVVPPQPAQQAPPTTVVIQTGPQGQMQVVPSGSGSAPAGGASAGAPQGPRNPYAPPPGGSNNPPAVQVNSGPTVAPPTLPLSGLP